MKQKEICFKWFFLKAFNIVLLKYKKNKENKNFFSDLSVVFSKLRNMKLEQGSVLSR